mmetsp:Transcript_2244/g.7456  ORF Transcript_2244/g.7456 Transcript_2244/m.7456 type:complete len:285 (-) Transcript_2244:3365-4219(-)
MHFEELCGFVRGIAHQRHRGVARNRQHAHRHTVDAKTQARDSTRVCIGDIRLVQVELDFCVRLDATAVAKLKPSAKLRLEQRARTRHGTHGGGNGAGPRLFSGESSSVSNLHRVLQVISHGWHGGRGAVVRAFVIVAVIGGQARYVAAPRLRRVRRIRRHKHAQVIIVVRHVLRGVNPPVFLPLLWIAAFNVVKSVEFHGERLFQARVAVRRNGVERGGIRHCGFAVSQAVARAANHATTVCWRRRTQRVRLRTPRHRVGTIGGSARPTLVAVEARHGFLTIVV